MLADQASQLTPTWELINLGRCWDFCKLEVTEAFVLQETGRLVRSPSPLCTNAYVVTTKGAKKIVSLITPHVLSIDQTIALFGRMQALKILSLSPRMWIQLFDTEASEDVVHDVNDKPECDPGWKEQYEQFFDGDDGWMMDKNVLAIGENHWSRLGHCSFARECSTTSGDESITTLTANTSACNNTLVQSRCRFLGGNPSSSGRRIRAERDLLKAMKTIGLQGFVVWYEMDCPIIYIYVINMSLF
jgi:hypothetical protein